MKVKARTENVSSISKTMPRAITQGEHQTTRDTLKLEKRPNPRIQSDSGSAPFGYASPPGTMSRPLRTGAFCQKWCIIEKESRRLMSPTSRYPKNGYSWRLVPSLRLGDASPSGTMSRKPPRPVVRPAAAHSFVILPAIPLGNLRFAHYL
jgi:hypothetical protein